MNSFSSLYQNAFDNLNTFNLCMQVGLGASTFLTFSQLGAGLFGIMPLILGKDFKQQNPQQSTKQIIQFWNFFFSRATKPVVGSVLLSSLAFGLAAFNVPSSTINQIGNPIQDGNAIKSFFSSSSSATTTPKDLQLATKNFLLLTAFVAILPLPFTAIRLLPNISALQKLLNKSSTWTKAEEDLAMKNVQLWNSGHKIRVTMYALTTFMGIFAYNAAP